jgi:V8-like Glu-specific endopeptidase
MKKIFVHLMFFTVILMMTMTVSGSVGEIFAETLIDGESENAVGEIDSEDSISGSPYLQVPDEIMNAPPALPPDPMEVLLMKAAEDPTGTEMYDVATGEVTSIPSDDFTQVSVESESVTPPYEGLLPSGLLQESVIGTDGRSRITSVTSFPWRTVVSLYIVWPDNAGGGCSGAMIDKFHVLTAGHCIYSHSHGGWAKSVRVMPGRNGSYMPYSSAWSKVLRTYTAWTSSADHRHDWAVVTLDRNIGNFTGWMGRMTQASSSSIYTSVLNTAGYPGDKPSGTMWFDADNGRYANEYNHWYYMDTYKGQSGSAVWRLSSGSRYILTVHAYGKDSSNSNHGTRLNSDKYNRIPTWTGADTAPTDRADLIDDGTSYMGFSPTTVTPGVTTFYAYSDVRNVGTKSSGGFYVSYYASTNTNITTSDYLLCNAYVSSISAFNRKDSTCPNTTVPANIPAGTYYVGAIVDRTNLVTEFDELNNTAYKSSPKLVVVAGGQPKITSPSPGATLSCTGTQTFTWTASGASVNQWFLYVGTSFGSYNIQYQEMEARFMYDSTGK